VHYHINKLEQKYLNFVFLHIIHILGNLFVGKKNRKKVQRSIKQFNFSAKILDVKDKIALKEARGRLEELIRTMLRV